LNVVEQVLHQLLLCCLLAACFCQFSNNLVKVSLQLIELLVNFLLLRCKNGHVLWKIASLSSHRVRFHSLSLNIIQEIMTSSQKLLVGKFPNLILGQSTMASWRLVDFMEAIPINKKRIDQLLCHIITSCAKRGRRWVDCSLGCRDRSGDESYPAASRLIFNIRKGTGSPYMLSCLTKLEKLLCLKCLGSTSLENSIMLHTMNEVPV